MKIAVQESVNVCAGQDRRIRRHAEHGNAVTNLDVRIDEPLKHAFDEGIDRLAGLGREHGDPLGQTIVERDACRHVPLLGHL